jgi:hypothetical protein
MLAGTLILLSGGMCALQQQTTPWRRGVDNISDLILTDSSNPIALYLTSIILKLSIVLPTVVIHLSTLMIPQAILVVAI